MNTPKSIWCKICDSFNVCFQMRDEIHELRSQLEQERRANRVIMERLRLAQQRLARATKQTASLP